ncbi:hypothetical protein AMELA_G00150670 [Ameiurus melas]|uniref:Uncharacterized protein n=1 Tax=Ameiurus melas TaxID=219545 RepID=A0A7J6AHZ7_AMEME|nr:hypothetical protein AMELA_G00150670 [Ameiurus melas]
MEPIPGSIGHKAGYTLDRVPVPTKPVATPPCCKAVNARDVRIRSHSHCGCGTARASSLLSGITRALIGSVARSRTQSHRRPSV